MQVYGKTKWNGQLGSAGMTNLRIGIVIIRGRDKLP